MSRELIPKPELEEAKKLIQVYSTRGSLGVKQEYLIDLMQRHGLDQDDLETLLVTKLRFRAAFTTMDQLLDDGVSSALIQGYYSVRKQVEANVSNTRKLSIVWLRNFAETFSDLDPQFTEILCEDVEHCLERYEEIFGKHNPDTALKSVVRVADERGIATLEAALDALDPDHPVNIASFD